MGTSTIVWEVWVRGATCKRLWLAKLFVWWASQLQKCGRMTWNLCKAPQGLQLRPWLSPLKPAFLPWSHIVVVCTLAGFSWMPLLFEIDDRKTKIEKVRVREVRNWERNFKTSLATNEQACWFIAEMSLQSKKN